MNTKIFKIYIKDNYFIAEEVGGTNLFHAYGSKEVRADVKYIGDDEFTFYQNHSGLAILGMENIPYSQLQKEDGTPFTSATEVANFIFEFTQNYGGTGGSGTPTNELDALKSELIPIIVNGVQHYLREVDVVDNTTGTFLSITQTFYDKNLNVVATPTNYEVGTVNKLDASFLKTYYTLGGNTYEGYTRLVDNVQVVYDLELDEVVGAVVVQEPTKTVTVSNQTTVGSDNKHHQVLAGNSLSFSDFKCISFLIKGYCTITIDGVAIDYEDGDSFSFSSENVLVNDITINQTTGKTIILTLE